MPVDDPGQACDLLATQFGELSKPSRRPGSAPATSPCWLPKLQDQDPVSGRARLRAGRAGAADAFPRSPRPPARSSSCPRGRDRALDWLAAVPAARPALKEVAPRLSAQLAQEQGRPQSIKSYEELRRLQLKISRL